MYRGGRPSVTTLASSMPWWRAAALRWVGRPKRRAHWLTQHWTTVKVVGVEGCGPETEPGRISGVSWQPSPEWAVATWGDRGAVQYQKGVK